MKKSVAIAVGIAVLGVAYTGATAWTGQKIASTYQDAIASVQAAYPMVRITDQSYDKHFFSATHTMTVLFGCDPDASHPEARPFKLTLVNTIHHGPFAGGTLAAATIDTELVLTPEAQAEVTKAFGSAEPISAHTRVGFMGGLSSTLSSPPGMIDLPEAHVAWKGMTLKASTDSDHRTLDVSLKLPGMELTDTTRGTPTSGIGMKFAGLDIESSTRAVTEHSWLHVGKGSGTLESLEITPTSASAKPVKLLLSGLKFSDDTTVDKDLFAKAFSLTASGMLNDSKIDKIELRTSVKNLHAPTYERILAAFMKTSQCGTDARAEAIAKAQQLQKDLLALLPYNPGMRLDKLLVEVDGKQADMSVALDMQGVAADTQALSIPLLMKHAVAAADFKLPVAWTQPMAARAGFGDGNVEMVDVMLQDAATKGFLVRDGDDIKSSLKFDKGQLILNGKSMPLGGSKG